MAQNRIGGPGISLPYPQALYPTSLIGAAPQAATNEITLAAGQAIPIPPGDWAVVAEKGVSAIQYQDPVTGIWGGLQPINQTEYVHSDGQNVRIANLTGCPVGATVTTTGTTYTQATTTVTAGTGNSTWVAVVGGALNTSMSITAAGSGYTIAPLVLIPAPPNPGVQATAHATISSGTVASIVVDNQGAGYATAPTITILPSPYDVNAGAVVNATATSFLTGSGGVTAVLCTDSGAPLASAPTLTIAGGDGTAAATANMLWTATTASITAGGVGYSASTEITSVGGLASPSTVYTNPRVENQILRRPRKASMSVALTSTSITSVGSVYDGGLFTGTPTTMVVTNAVATTAATVVLTLGNTTDTVTLQPL